MFTINIRSIRYNDNNDNNDIITVIIYYTGNEEEILLRDIVSIQKGFSHAGHMRAGMTLYINNIN